MECGKPCHYYVCLGMNKPGRYSGGNKGEVMTVYKFYDS
jgi:hypothetical protein